MLLKITENRDRGKQLETKETTVQFGMPPYVKDDTLERKLSTKPNQYTGIRKSAQAANSTIGKKYTGSMDTKAVLQSQELYLENVKVLASRSNWLVNDHCEMTWPGAQLVFSLYSEAWRLFFTLLFRLCFEKHYDSSNKETVKNRQVG